MTVGAAEVTDQAQAIRANGERNVSADVARIVNPRHDGPSAGDVQAVGDHEFHVVGIHEADQGEAVRADRNRGEPPSAMLAVKRGYCVCRVEDSPALRTGLAGLFPWTWHRDRRDEPTHREEYGQNDQRSAQVRPSEPERS